MLAAVLLAACPHPQKPAAPPERRDGWAPFAILPDRVVEGRRVGRVGRAIDARTLESTYHGAARRWSLSRNVEQLPKLSAPGFPLLETLHNLALEESLANVRPDRAFMAGAKWEGV